MQLTHYLLLFVFLLVSMLPIQAQNGIATIAKTVKPISPFVEGQIFIKINNYCDFSWADKQLQQTENLQNNFPAFYQNLQQHQVASIAKAFRFPHEKLNSIYLVKLADASKTAAFIRAMQKLNYVAYAEQVPLYRNFCVSNDPLFGDQWGLQNTFVQDAFDNLTNETCDFSAVSCADEITIAIIDDGVRLTHEDLAPNIWENPNEIAGNGLDDDGNGYIDDMNGWDASENDNDPNPDAAFITDSDFNHGTHCAGIAAAATNNNLGIASLGFNTKIVAVKCHPNSTYTGSAPEAYAGVDYAIATKVNIMNMSWGGNAFSASYQALFNVANSLGIVCVAAAGNSGVATPLYPASYEGVISVGASNENNQIAFFSNYGATVDIMAPGQNIISTLATADDAYGELNGTSMACPYIAGVVGLMLCFDSSLSPNAIETCMQETATNINMFNPGFTGLIGAGLINVDGILNCVKVPTVANFDIAFDFYCPNTAITFDNLTTGPPPISYQWDFPGGIPASSSNANPSVIYPATGEYTITLTATNEYGSNSLEQNITIDIPTASISGNSTIIGGSNINLTVNYNGSIPYSITYSDGTDEHTITDIITSPYAITVNPSDTTSYTLVNVNNGACDASISGTANINVIQLIEGNICQHTTIYGTEEENKILARSYYDIDEEIIYFCGKDPDLFAVDAKTGENIWDKKFNAFNVPNDITMAPGGDLVMAASTGGHLHVYRTTSNEGELLWAKRFANTTSVQIRPAIERGTNDSYFVSWYEFFEEGDHDIGVLKLDSNGNVLMAKVFDVNGGDDQFGEMISDGNGGVYITGEVELDQTVFLMHLDADLNVIQAAQYIPDTPYSLNNTFAICPLQDGGFALSAWRNGEDETEEYTTLFKLNSNWDFEWARAIYPTDAFSVWAQPMNILQDNEGNIYIDGNSKINLDFASYFVCKYTNDGEYLWSKTMKDADSFNLLEASPPSMVYNPNTPGYDFTIGCDMCYNDQLNRI